MPSRPVRICAPRASRRFALAASLLLTGSTSLFAASATQNSAARVTFGNSLVKPLSVADVKTTVSGRIVSGVTALSSTQLAAPLEFSVALEMRNLQEFQARVGSGELVSYEEVQAKYLPLQADYDRVLAWLKSEGFTPTFEDTSRLSVFVQGTVAQIQSSFEVTMQSVTVNGVAYPAAVTAPSLPVEVSSGVLGVNGLQPYLQKHTHHRTRKIGAPQANQTQSIGGAQPDSKASPNNPPYLIGEIRNAYNGGTLTTTVNGTTTTLTGSGQKTAILIDALAAHSDLTTFWSNNSVAQVIGNIEEVKVNGSAAASEGEETLDEEWSSGIAPGSKVRVYCSGALTDTALNKCLAQIQTDVTGSTAAAIAQPQLHALSMSYGEDQNAVSSSEYKTEASYYATIANGNTFYGGVSIFASSGDSGSQPDEPSSATIIASYPAADVSITGVGGTDLYYASTAVNGRNWTERGWGEVTSYKTSSGTTAYEYGGSGGGPATSTIARPAWQVGTGVTSGSTRLTPDVAAAGGPTYADVEYGGADTGFYGTSWSSPTWAGFAALINQARALQGRLPLGALNRRVYPLIGTASFYDTTTGNNSYLTPNASNLGKSGTGSFSCATGYDEVTGVGTPNLTNLVNALLGPSITSFTPAGGGAGTSVVITGTNFYTSTANPLTVTFNGTAAASVTVNSATQITAVAPSGVTAGPIKVTSIGDTATSATNFAQPAPDAQIASANPSSVSQGDNGDLFTFTVSNAGSAATAGATTATVLAGRGLHIVSVSGTGWTCAVDSGNSALWNCSRTDALAVGTSFPALTVSVNVSPSATTAQSVGLTAHVVAAGDSNSANDYSYDTFTINAATTTPTQQWRYNYFYTTANTGSAADTANPAGDGIPNLLKYALGLDPTQAEASPITVDISTGYLRLTTPKNANATDVTFSVQVNGDLTDPTGWTTTDTSVDQNSSTTLQVRDGTPVSGNAKRFLRLQVSR